ncbi:hypothetical protein, partial [Leptospira stimsonii]
INKFLIIGLFIPFYKSRSLAFYFTSYYSYLFLFSIYSMINHREISWIGFIFQFIILLLSIVLIRAVLFWNRYYDNKIRLRSVILLNFVAIIFSIIAIALLITLYDLYKNSVIMNNLFNSDYLFFGVIVFSYLITFSGILPFCRDSGRKFTFNSNI